MITRRRIMAWFGLASVPFATPAAAAPADRRMERLLHESTLKRMHKVARLARARLAITKIRRIHDWYRSAYGPFEYTDADGHGDRFTHKELITMFCEMRRLALQALDEDDLAARRYYAEERARHLKS